MSLADAVAALPGGGAFAALWDQVNGDPGAINDIADKLKITATKAEDCTHTISKASGEVGDAWHGPAASAFSSYMHRFGSAGSSVHSALSQAGSAVTEAADAVLGAKNQLNTIASRILDRAEELEPLKNNPLTKALYEGAVEKAVQEGCSDAEPIVHQLTSKLQDAASAIHSSVTSGGFVAMTAANAGTYLPPKGKPIQWNPVPHGLDGKHGGGTSPQSGGSGSGGSGSGGSSSGGSSSGGSSSGGSSSGGPPAGQPTGNVKQWIDEAKKILEQHGYKASQIDDAAINTIIQHESSGNPHAENDWDSNAAAGHPSKGLMQTIDSTFNEYKLPGHDDIWNPVDNIIAGVRYSISRYGSLDNVPGVKGVSSGSGYVGY